MRFILFLIIIIFNGVVANIPLMERFENWIQKFRIEFRDKHHFYDILRKWMVNDEYIDYVNKENKSYSLGHNQFSGMDEFDFIRYIIKNPIIQSNLEQST
jgi:hypothetical protein